MSLSDHTEKLRKARIAFWVSLLVCGISMSIVFVAMDSQVTWKIIASVIGFLGFLVMTIATFRKMMHLQKGN